MTREELMALADEFESMDAREGCRTCPADGTKDCRGDLSCEEAVARAASRRIREIAEHDAGEVTTASAYDLLSDDEREAIEWVREHGGLDEVEKRLMPEGMELLVEVWPKWSNGEYCKFGDWWKSDKYGEPEPQQSRKLSIYTPEQLDEWGQGDGESYGYEWDFVRPSDPKYRPDKVEPHVPKVLDADGVEIGIGDKLYDTETGCARIVRAINANGTVEFEGHMGRGWFTCFLTHRAPVLAADGKPLEVGQTVYHIADGKEYTVEELFEDGAMVTPDGITGGRCRAEYLTHTKPEIDTWERIEEDAGCTATKYNERRGTIFTTKQQVARDLVRRAKKLAGVSE